MMRFTKHRSRAMKLFWMSFAVFALAVCGFAQDGTSLGEAAKRNQEQKKASRTFTNDDVNSGTIESTVAPQSTNSSSTNDGQSKDDGSAKAESAGATADESAIPMEKPDRSNVAGDVPGYTPEPKDRIETLKQHASQWEAMIANFEKKIAAEKNPEK